MQAACSTSVGSCRSLGGQQLSRQVRSGVVAARSLRSATTCEAQRLKGRVISNAMDKTAVIEVSTFEKHRIYTKLMKKTSKYFAHDEDNSAEIGDQVQIRAIRPLSRKKRFEIVRTIAESDLNV